MHLKSIKHLVEITEKETKKLKDCDVRIYWTDVVIDSKWKDAEHLVQEGEDLGETNVQCFREGL